MKFYLLLSSYISWLSYISDHYQYSLTTSILVLLIFFFNLVFPEISSLQFSIVFTSLYWHILPTKCKPLYFCCYSSSVSPALLIFCYMLHISVLNFLFSRPRSPPTINLHCACFTGSLSDVLITFYSTTVIGSIPNTRTIQSVTISRKIVKPKFPHTLWHLVAKSVTSCAWECITHNRSV